tara:strand:+ start:346 stop:714 length:369 start_codon:yes stop_codon:yes gene_type:complete
MIISVKFLNNSLRIAAFSLIEILTVLVIVGIILTLPNWPLISANLLNRADNHLKLTQNKVDMAILTQSRQSSKKTVELSLAPICEATTITVYLGGWVEPVSLVCKGRNISVGSLGKLKFESE